MKFTKNFISIIRLVQLKEALQCRKKKLTSQMTCLQSRVHESINLLTRVARYNGAIEHRHA